MNFIEELTWRGLLKDATPGVEELLNNQMVTGYIGFDPTAPALTIGNYVPIMLLTLFQRSGHQPVVLMGGATGRIGDPSGRETERELKSAEELDANLAHQAEQFKKLLNFEEGPNKAIMVNNLDFYQGMSVLDFLRDAGKTLTVNYMLSKDAVKNRMEGGISFTEFSYQLLQAYDFEVLFKKYNCVLQMGGSDQWGNIVTGIDLGRRMGTPQLYALTSPLLTTASGAKMGKTAAGAVWLEADMLPVYDYWQFWRNADDRDVGRFLRLFTDLPLDEIARLEALEGAAINDAKVVLANEATRLCRGEDAARAAEATASATFAGGGLGEDLPVLEVPAEGMAIAVACKEIGFAASNGEARRKIAEGAVRIDGEAVSDPNHLVVLAPGQSSKISLGKKRHGILRAA